MDRERFISRAPELRRIAVGAALALVDSNEAEDVAQEAMIKMWENVQRLDEARLAAYVAVTAQNMAKNRLRQKRRHPLIRLLDKFDHKSDDTPLRQLETSESDKAFTIAMNRLPSNWQRVMQMRNVENMSFAEIAAVLGTSESSVRGLLSKARTRMVELINQQIR